MCGIKRLNPFFRLHEASEVLNKYVMGVCAGPSQGFRIKGGKKTQGGATVFKYNIGCMQQPGANYEMGCRTPLAPTGDDPGVWSNSPLPFWLVSL